MIHDEALNQNEGRQDRGREANFLEAHLTWVSSAEATRSTAIPSRFEAPAFDESHGRGMQGNAAPFSGGHAP
jgi:hypothetical protein